MTGADAVGEANLSGRAPRMKFFAKLQGDVIQEASFTVFGCCAAIACGSAVMVLIRGKSIRDCRLVDECTVCAELNGIPENKYFCAEIAVRALKSLLENCEIKTKY